VKGPSATAMRRCSRRTPLVAGIDGAIRGGRWTAGVGPEVSRNAALVEAPGDDLVFGSWGVAGG
jgi:hypothetical protein